jgi:hypothetical protein
MVVTVAAGTRLRRTKSRRMGTRRMVRVTTTMTMRTDGLRHQHTYVVQRPVDQRFLERRGHERVAIAGVGQQVQVDSEPQDIHADECDGKGHDHDEGQAMAEQEPRQQRLDEDEHRRRQGRPLHTTQGAHNRTRVTARQASS